MSSTAANGKSIEAEKPSSDGPMTVAERPFNGRFAPGNKYGRGRALGSRNRATTMLDSMAQGVAQVILNAAIAAALAGDVSAMKLILDRVYPARRGRPTPFKIEAVLTLPVSQITAALIEAVGAGELTSAEAVDVSRLVNQHRAAIELDVIEQRIAKLERRNGFGD